ncbi:hypothetical protein ACFTZI_19790 [Streptomyces decoyicus]
MEFPLSSLTRRTASTAAQPTRDLPDRAIVAAAPEAWQGEPIRVLDLDA